MATIHLKETFIFGDTKYPFWSINKIEDVAKEGRTLFCIEVQEYIIIAGDIGGDQTDKMKKYLDDWKSNGHTLIFSSQEIDSGSCNNCDQKLQNKGTVDGFCEYCDYDRKYGIGDQRCVKCNSPWRQNRCINGCE